MKPYVVKNKEFIKFFCQLSPSSKSRVVNGLNENYINTISEICKNFLERNLTQDPKIIQKLKKSRTALRIVSLKKTPLYKKKKILQSRSGGAILSVLLPLAAGLISSIFSRK